MLRPFADWLAKTPISAVFQDWPWIIPTSQSIHIIGVSIVFVTAILINLRLLGTGPSRRSVLQLTSALLPWMWRGLAVLLATGIIQIIAEPVRQFVTPEFWAKMMMIVIVSLMTRYYARAVFRNAATWDGPDSSPPAAKAFAVVSTLLWLGIVICGRLIGYVWSLYE
jgi:hypothetical protein